MQVEGQINAITVDGYERLLRIQLENGEIFCSYRETEDYLDLGQISTRLKVNDKIAFSASLEFVMAAENVDPSADQVLTQPICASPSTILVGKVIRKIESNSYLLSIGGAIEINVRFELDVELRVTDCIRARGELTAEDVWVNGFML